MTTQPSQPMNGHTPTPWTAHGRFVGVKNHLSLIAECRDQNGNWTNEPMALANAAFIVEAVNSHAALKARIEDLEGLLAEIAEYLKTQSDRITMELIQESFAPRRSQIERHRNAFVTAENTLRAVLQSKGAA